MPIRYGVEASRVAARRRPVLEMAALVLLLVLPAAGIGCAALSPVPLQLGPVAVVGPCCRERLAWPLKIRALLVEIRSFQREGWEYPPYPQPEPEVVHWDVARFSIYRMDRMY